MPCAFTISVVQPAPPGSALGGGYEVVHRRVILTTSTSCGVAITGRADPPSVYTNASGDYIFAFAIEWVCDCLEITLAQHHGSDVPTEARVKGRVEFHGLEIKPQKLIFVSLHFLTDNF